MADTEADTEQHLMLISVSNAFRDYMTTSQGITKSAAVARLSMAATFSPSIAGQVFSGGVAKGILNWAQKAPVTSENSLRLLLLVQAIHEHDVSADQGEARITILDFNVFRNEFQNKQQELITAMKTKATIRDEDEDKNFEPFQCFNFVNGFVASLFKTNLPVTSLTGLGGMALQAAFSTPEAGDEGNVDLWESRIIAASYWMKQAGEALVKKLKDNPDQKLAQDTWVGWKKGFKAVSDVAEQNDGDKLKQVCSEVLVEMERLEQDIVRSHDGGVTGVA